MTPLHPRAFKASVAWTLGLLFLGSVVHATESSLACPDWPTCFGTMVPEMTGGVFWEHLHRLVAGGLLLLWALATWLVWKERRGDRPLFTAALAGAGLLLVQSVFGGLTVILRLPDLVSTTHLALALGFLALATALASATGWARDAVGAPGIRTEAMGVAVLVGAQSVLGALVRHADAGLACPDVPLCIGRVVPPLDNALVNLHFGHRVLAVVVTAAVLHLVWRTFRTAGAERLRRAAGIAGGLVLLQVVLGVLSVTTRLGVAPVSLHTLVAAGLLVALVHLAVAARPAVPAAATSPSPVPVR